MDWFDAVGDPVHARQGDDGEPLSLELIVAGAMIAFAFFALQYSPGVSLAILGSEAALFVWLRVRRRLRHRRRDPEEIERLAKAAGLRHAAPGEFDLYRLPFPIFRTGEWQGFDNVYARDFGRDRVWVFDSWYGFEMRGQDVEEHFTCAVMEVGDADCPKLSITRENPWSRTWSHMGWRDIEVESEDFNRRFDVSGDDERFAFAFLSPSMIEWLQSTPAEFEFAVEGRWLLCRARWLPTKRWWDLLRMIRDFRGSMPKTLERLWPESGSRRFLA